MITLYHSPFTRSHLVRFLLEELGLPHEIARVDVNRGEHKSGAYMEIHPLGQLPALVDDGRVIVECGAIALHLADKAPPGSRVAPPLGTPERAAYYQWVLFAFATELFALSKIAMHTRFLPEPARVSAIADEGRAAWVDVARTLSRAVEGRRWLLGDDFTTADVVVGGSLWLASFIGVLGDDPHLGAYYRRVSERPAFQRAFEDAR